MSSQAFNITLPKDLVAKVDKLAKANYTSRSDIIRRAVIREIMIQDDQWQTVADFTTIRPDGVDAGDILAVIKSK